jgi:C4-dicarboxylate-specific signal transduction histidine kinase
MVLQ